MKMLAAYGMAIVMGLSAVLPGPCPSSPCMPGSYPEGFGQRKSIFAAEALAAAPSQFRQELSYSSYAKVFAWFAGLLAAGLIVRHGLPALWEQIRWSGAGFHSILRAESALDVFFNLVMVLPVFGAAAVFGPWTDFWRHPSANAASYEGDVGRYWSSVLMKTWHSNKNARVLDAGTGLSALFRSAWPFRSMRLIAVDVAQLPRWSLLPYVRYLRASVRQLPLTSGSLDAVISMHAIEYADLEQALVEIAGVLKPDGKGYFIVHHPESIHARRLQDFGKPHLMSALRQKLTIGEESLRMDREPVLETAANGAGASNGPVHYVDMVLREARRNWLEEGADAAMRVLRDRKEYFEIIASVSSQLLGIVENLGDPNMISQWVVSAGLHLLVLEPFKDRGDLIGWRLEVVKPRSAAESAPRSVPKSLMATA